ncbi:hypothetical protein PS898_00051 [Pseudomonas fluorescens]|nr:hypothetical protein PS898_00051 [Pseudomonas fluorescens]
MPGVFVSGVWDFGFWVLGFGFWVLGVYPLLRVLLIRVSPLRRVTFSKRRKGNPKGFAPAYGTSLRLSVPSLRCPSGGIDYGLLRCTSSRCMRLRRTALRAYPLMNTYARPADGAKDQKPKQDQKPDQEPLTLALSRREKGLTGVLGRTTPTCDTESNSGFEKHTNRLPVPLERAGARGKSTTKPKPTASPFHHSTG